MKEQGPRRRDASVTGLAPDTEHALAVDGLPADELVPTTVRTLVPPPGALLATIATVNDVHFGETVCGMIHTAPRRSSARGCGPRRASRRTR